MSAVVMLGMVGLATEAGTWYAIRASAQNAADAAAMAGALAAKLNNDPLAAAHAAARSNGYTNAVAIAAGEVTVTPTFPSTSWCQRGDQLCAATATEVTISVNVTPLFAKLFDSTTPSLTVTAHAVGAMQPIEIACVLSTSLDLVISGSQNSPSCTYASNAATTSAVQISAPVTAYTITTVGDCSTSGCAYPGNNLIRPYSTYQPSTMYGSAGASPTGYLAVDQWFQGLMTSSSTASMPCSSGSCCLPPPAAGTATLVPAKSNGLTYNGALYTWSSGSDFYAYVAGCNGITSAGISIGAGAWTLRPGTYYFVNTSLNIAGGGTVICTVDGTLGGTPCPEGQGVSFVFTGTTGSSVGLSIDAATTVKLGAPNYTRYPIANDTTYSVLNGMLFYLDPRLFGTVSIQEAPDTILSGGMYFPNATTSFGANSGTGSPSSCSILIGNNVTLVSAAGSPVGNFGYTACAPTYGTFLPQVQAPRLVN